MYKTKTEERGNHERSTLQEKSTSSQSEPALHRENGLVNREFDFDPQEADPGREEAEEIQEHAARAADGLHLFFEDGAGGVPG